ncbi:MAG: AMP-binding protein [Saprospiraceae bacterium]|nr:AMP-binding protein [Candidatus Vicinibacter affinis]
MHPFTKKIFTGGAPVFPSEAALYNKAFPEAKVEIVYGSTEAEPISSITANELMNESGNFLKTGLKVGIPYRKSQVKIIKIINEAILCTNEKEFNDIILPLGSIGEIIVCGPHVLKEYFNNDVALKQNKIFFKDTCWHRTGDSGYMDEKNQIFLTGRCSTLIYYKNRIIAPFIYEKYFSSLEEIEMGTVLQLNNKLLAIIELKAKAKKKAIVEQIRSVDIDFDEIKFISKMPRDPRHFSKIDYEKIIFRLLNKIK